jgi:hypothetical protein
MVRIAYSNFGDGSPNRLNREHTMSPQAMIWCLLGRLDGLSEQVDPLGIGRRSTIGAFNLVNKVKRLAQHVGCILAERGQREGKRCSENDHRTVTDEFSLHLFVGEEAVCSW